MNYLLQTVAAVLLILYAPVARSQPSDPVADSLLKSLSAATEDTAKVHTYIELGYTLNAYDPDRALNYASEGMALSKRIGFNAGTAELAYVLSDTWLNLGNYEKAKSMLDESERMYSSPENSAKLGKIYNARGNWYYMQSDMWNASHYYSKAVDIFQQLKDTVRIIIPYQNLIASLGETKNYERAISLSKKLLKTLEDRKDSLRMAATYQHLIINYLALQNPDEAYAYIPPLLSFAETTLEYNIKSEAYNIAGKYYVEKKQYDTAISYYKKAIATALKDNYQTSLYNLSIGEAYLRKGDLSNAGQHLQLAEQQSQKANSRDIFYRVSEVWSEYYERKKDYRNAFTYLQEFTKLNDSFLVAETRQYAAQLEAVYENNKKETEIRTLKTEQLEKTEAIRHRNNILYVAGGFLLLAAIALVLQIQNARNKRRLLEQEKQLQSEKILALQREQQVSSLQSMITGQETERTRIARDLHDGLGGVFSTVKMYFSSLQHENPGLAQSPLFVKSFEMVDNASGELRRIAHNLMPEVLMKLGLINAIQDMCNSIQAGRLLRISLQAYSMEKRLNNNIEIMLYRIIQELLNNIIKHAEASEVIIQFNRHSDRLTITIEDNGKGFDVEQATSANHAGIDTVKSRVNYLNGEMSIESNKNVGTTVIMEFMMNHLE
ncbi:MAG: hypothetical protein KF746_23225 [Chitinophagaceae bacterium]|nr:hypothetical protein [Chitinophagaceae bacterium]